MASPPQPHVVGAVQGDLVTQQVDALVNAANEHLAHGGGVAAALVRAGGETIQQESDEWVAVHGPLQPGSAAVTGAGSLRAGLLVHVVGPRYAADQDNAALLRQAVVAALDAATARGARTVAMPAISSGIFGYPRRDACRVIATAAREWVDSHPGALDEIRLVGWDRETAEDFAAAL